MKNAIHGRFAVTCIRRGEDIDEIMRLDCGMWNSTTNEFLLAFDGNDYWVIRRDADDGTYEATPHTDREDAETHFLGIVNFDDPAAANFVAVGFDWVGHKHKRKIGNQ
jgi:hypothetical protein